MTDYGSRSNRPVLLFQRIVPSHRVPVFKRLGEELDVVVCHSDAEIQGNPSYHKVMDYPNVLLPGRFVMGRGNLFSQRIFRVLLDYRPDVVICEYAFGVITFWKLLLLRLFFRFRLIGWSHGIKNRDMVLSQKTIHYRLNGYILKMLDAAIIYSDSRKDQLGHRFPEVRRKLFTAHNTLDTGKYTSVFMKYSADGSQNIKREIGIQSDFTIVYLGRMLKEKRIDLIVEAWRILKKKYDIGLICIGEGEERERLLHETPEKDLLLPGAIHDIEQSGKYLTAAEVIVNPGYVGLSIVHAFAFGLPMITCRSTGEGPFHSPEIEYLKDGYNGFLCDSDAKSIAACIERLILNPELLAQMKENALKTIEEEANIERMIGGFREAIEYVLRNDD